MHANWQRIQDKWPLYRVDKADERVVDVARCVFCGEGNHEFAVYSHGRYLRQAERQFNPRYPICICFGIHYPDYVSDDEPAIGHLRTSVCNDTTGMPEPALLLAVIACMNGRAYWDELWKELAGELVLDMSSQSARWVLSNIETVLKAGNNVLTRDLTPFVEETPPEFCGVILSASEFPPEQFVGYEPSEHELSPLRTGNWVYPLNKELKKGAEGRQPARERIVLKEDLRRVDASLYKGQLGWTVPDPGFGIKKGTTSLNITVVFDSGVTIPVDVYWIDFIREECAEVVAEKIIASYRTTPFDADPDVAVRWHRDLPFYIPSETIVVGRGLDEVYAYSYLSCMDEAAFQGEPHYPVKIGYTTGVDGALERINGQFPRALADDARVLFIGRCNDGRAVESKIHRHIKQDGRKIKSAPGKEWFATNTAEVVELFAKYGG